MKLRVLGIGTLALGLLTGGYSFSSLASSNDENEKGEQLIKAEVKVLKPGEKEDISKGKLEMNKKVIDEEGKVKSNVKTFEPGEMPEVPEGAVTMKKTVTDSEKEEK
ncbi:MAG TPA: hypothetical protein DCW76_05460 [Lysinibacillus sp.]|nr:hypothetical protein [Lysinibacillus sp.]